MKNKLKHFTFFSACILSLSAVSPVTALANTSYQQTTISSSSSRRPTSNLSIGQQSFSDEQISEMATELHKLHPDLSVEYLKEGIYKQLRGDYSISSIDGFAFRSAWQGVTVSQMGAFLNTAISIALGGVAGGVANAIKSKGRAAATRAIRNALIQKGMLAGFMTNSVLTFAANLLDPGTYLARLWDSRDRVPNNGRINF